MRRGRDPDLAVTNLVTERGAPHTCQTTPECGGHEWGGHRSSVVGRMAVVLADCRGDGFVPRACILRQVRKPEGDRQCVRRDDGLILHQGLGEVRDRLADCDDRAVEPLLADSQPFSVARVSVSCPSDKRLSPCRTLFTLTCFVGGVRPASRYRQLIAARKILRVPSANGRSLSVRATCARGAEATLTKEARDIFGRRGHWIPSRLFAVSSKPLPAPLVGDVGVLGQGYPNGIGD